jgi:hypothetical protein
VRRFGAIDRPLRARFAPGERELPLLQAIKGTILAAKPPESGECRFKSMSRFDLSQPRCSGSSIMK